jgi:hypothetical protein
MKPTPVCNIFRIANPESKGSGFGFPHNSPRTGLPPAVSCDPMQVDLKTRPHNGIVSFSTGHAYHESSRSRPAIALMSTMGSGVSQAGSLKNNVKTKEEK